MKFGGLAFCEIDCTGYLTDNFSATIGFRVALVTRLARCGGRAGSSNNITTSISSGLRSCPGSQAVKEETIDVILRQRLVARLRVSPGPQGSREDTVSTIFLHRFVSGFLVFPSGQGANSFVFALVSSGSVGAGVGRFSAPGVWTSVICHTPFIIAQA